MAPDGTVTQVAGAAQNGAHRESAESPKALVPGETFPLEIEMHFTSWVFPKGHRIRLAVNNAHVADALAEPLPDDDDAAARRCRSDTRPAADRPARGPAEAVRSSRPPRTRELPGFGTLAEGTTSGYGEISRVERDVAARSTKVVALNSGRDQYPWGTSRYEESITHEAPGRPSGGRVGDRGVPDDPRRSRTGPSSSRAT